MNNWLTHPDAPLKYLPLYINGFMVRFGRLRDGFIVRLTDRHGLGQSYFTTSTPNQVCLALRDGDAVIGERQDGQ